MFSYIYIYILHTQNNFHQDYSKEYNSNLVNTYQLWGLIQDKNSILRLIYSLCLLVCFPAGFNNQGLTRLRSEARSFSGSV